MLSTLQDFSSVRSPRKSNIRDNQRHLLFAFGIEENISDCKQADQKLWATMSLSYHNRRLCSPAVEEAMKFMLSPVGRNSFEKWSADCAGIYRGPTGIRKDTGYRLHAVLL